MKISWPWLLLALLAGFVLALYFSHRKLNLRSKELKRLRKLVHDTQVELNEANPLLHGDKTDVVWWRRN